MVDILQIERLSIGYRYSKKKQVSLAKNINAGLAIGSFTALVGRNGAGKSTLLKTLSGLHMPLGGNILLEQKNLKSYSRKDMATKLSLVFANKFDSGNFTVYEMVSLGRYPYTNLFGKLSGLDKKLVNQAIEDLDISHLANRRFMELSDGEKQKTLFARSLAQDTQMIFLDEPTAHLDYPSRLFVFQFLQKLAREKQKAILISTHELLLAQEYADELWVLDGQGKLHTARQEKPLTDSIWQNVFGVIPRRSSTTFL
ncbi:MAG: ABC transporter ATP-binding protein [Spirochaetota bacterium]